MDNAADSALPPVRRIITVPLSRAEAFDLFVRRLPEWWPLETRSVGLENAVSCHVEACLGGRLFERSRSGEESCWGTFLAFAEPERVVFTWHPGAPASIATEVEVSFLPIPSGTAVSLEHRHWERLGEKASFLRGLIENGWPSILACFEALARGEAELPEVQGPGCIEQVREKYGDSE